MVENSPGWNFPNYQSIKNFKKILGGPGGFKMWGKVGWGEVSLVKDHSFFRIKMHVYLNYTYLSPSGPTRRSSAAG